LLLISSLSAFGKNYSEVLMLWILFALGAALSWGLVWSLLCIADKLSSGNPMRALLCVGIAYFLIGVLVPVVTLSSQGELSGFTMKGSVGATIAGALGAAGRGLHHLRIQIRRLTDLRDAARLCRRATRQRACIRCGCIRQRLRRIRCSILGLFWQLWWRFGALLQTVVVIAGDLRVSPQNLASLTRRRQE
jgi:xanthosine utilization system XapX-like protein